MAQAAIDAADAAEKAAIAELTEKAEADKALAVEAKKAKEAEAKAAEVAKKEAEKAAADAAKACELANKKRKEEDARRAKEREAAAKKAAKDKSKKTTAELQEEEAAKLERLAKALEEQARREYEAARAPLTLQPLESYAVDGAVPDKGSTWQYPTQSDGWFRIHNTIRAEMTKLAAAIDACAATGEPLPAWKVDAIKSYWSLHSALVHAHHAHEDDIFYPLLATRCALPPKLEIVHGDILELSAAVDLAVNALEPGADLVPLVSAFDAYKASMEPHLAEEEAVCVPRARVLQLQGDRRGDGADDEEDGPAGDGRVCAPPGLQGPIHEVHEAGEDPGHRVVRRLQVHAHQVQGGAGSRRAGAAHRRRARAW